MWIKIGDKWITAHQYRIFTKVNIFYNPFSIKPGIEKAQPSSKRLSLFLIFMLQY
jgi:hypothetical protein